MGINKVNYGNTTLIDTSNVTVTADKLAQGYTALDNTGTLITGTSTSGGYITQDANGYVVLSPTNGVPTLINKTITENGTYSASTDGATGYSNVTVNVSGGGSMNTSTDFAISNYDYKLTFSNIQSEPSQFVLVFDNIGTSQSLYINNHCVSHISYNGTTTDAYAIPANMGSTLQYYKFGSSELTWSYSSSQHKLTFTIDSNSSYFFDSNADSTWGYRLYYV